MNTAGKLAAYGAAVVLVAAGAWTIGSAVGPFPGAAGVSEAEGSGRGGGHSDTVAAAPDGPAGLASSRGGYTLTPVSTTLTAGQAQPFSFRITGPDGDAVTDYEIAHDKRMHLIVVRRDRTGFQHVHPEMSADGLWTVRMGVDTPGVYRAFADFTPTGGEARTLGVDLFADGAVERVEHTDSRVAEVDGYQVRLDGDLTAGQSSDVTATVTKDGAPVTNLRPYLGAYGHLVALRAGDLAYLHVHPDGTPGPDVGFAVEVPSAGSYRLFLDFQHDGKVRTAAFTVTVGGQSIPEAPVAQAPTTDDGHGEPGHGH